MAVPRSPPFGNYDVISTSEDVSLLVAELERNTFRYTIYPPSLIVIDLILPELYKEGSRIRRINKIKISDRHMEDFILHRVYVRSSYCFHYSSFEVKKLH